MATDQGGKSIPGIPLGALDAIGDANVRDVLRALVATHNVRNNIAGSGNDAFITERQALLATRTSALSGDTASSRLLARYVQGNGGGPFGGGSLSGPLATLTVSLDRPTDFQATVVWQAAAQSTSNTRVEIHNGNGVVLLSQSYRVRGSYIFSHTASAGFRLEPGTHALTLHAGNNSGGSNSLSAWSVLLIPVNPAA